jgi:hypothetical protein
MPRILTTCPESGQTVPTGHRTTDFELSDMTLPRAFRCPVCHQVHAWSRDNATVEDISALVALRRAAA